MDLQRRSFKPCKTMALRETSHAADSDLFRQELSNIINLRHPLVQLAQKIDWQSCESRFGGLYAAGVGRPGHPIRLMVGLQLLKHTCNVSDEEVVATWVETRKLRTYLGRIIRDIERKMQPSGVTPTRMQQLLRIATRIHTQPRKRSEGDPPKLYSVHAPEVECIAKGKAHKQYEFGVKVGIVSTSKESFVLAAKSLPGNPYDGHTLQACMEQATRVTGVAPQEAYADRGYKGHGCNTDTFKVWISGAKRGVTQAVERKIKRRNAVEPVIGHLKSDGRLARNFLKGVEGDAMNALLCGAGHNLRKIIRKLRLFYAFCEFTLRDLLSRLLLPDANLSNPVTQFRQSHA